MRGLGARRRPVAVLCLVAALLGLTGCATSHEGFAPVAGRLRAGQPDVALRLLDRQHDASGDRVLYDLNRGMLLAMTGQYVASNEAFERAKQRMRALYGISVHQQAEAFAINDAVRSYQGPEFERVLVHLYEALNYLALGRMDDARVEAAQVDLRLRLLTERAPQAAYRDDAFAQYLTGIIYEDLGEWSDAMVSYRHAQQAYRSYQRVFGVPMPSFLKYDLLRLAQHLGLNDTVHGDERAFGIDHWMPLRQLRRQGELIFLFNDGLVPRKRAHSLLLADPYSGQWIRVSLPYYPTLHAIDHVAVVRVGAMEATTVVAENIGAIAVHTLHDQMPAITARALGRAVVKYQAAREAARHSPLDGLLVNLAGVLTENADTRGWYTLPNDIQIARLALTPGTYTIHISVLNRVGQVVGVHEFPNVTVRAGRKRFLSYFWAAPHAVRGER